MASCKKDGNAVYRSSAISEKIKSTALMDESHRNRVLDSIFESIIKCEPDTSKTNLLFKVAGSYYNSGSYEKYRNVCDHALEFSYEVGDSLSIAKSLQYLGDYHETKPQLDSALLYYIKSEKVYRKVRDSLNTGKLQLYKAGILYDIGGYAESEVLTIDALGFLKTKNSTRLRYECYVQVALSLKELENYEKSLHYFDTALKTLESLKMEGYDEYKILLSKASCYNNIGQLFLKKQEYYNAKSYFEAALETPTIIKRRPALYAMLLNNLAAAKISLHDYDNVEKLLFESLNVREAQGLKLGIVASKLNIAEFYLQNGDTLKAVNYTKDGYFLAKQIDSNYDILKALTFLVQHDKRNTGYYTKLYITSSKEIYEFQIRTRNKFGRIAYESDLTDQENKILKKKNIYIVICAVIGGILLFALLIIHKLNSRRKELLYQQEQQNSNEKIYTLLLTQKSSANDARNKERKRIAMDLHDRVVNRVFTTRFNLMQLGLDNETKKNELIEELESTEEDIRQISHDLSKNIFADATDFYEITRSYLDSQQFEGKVVFELFIDKYIDWSVVIIEVKINLYSIIQEAVKNVIKHSGASMCNIAIFSESINLKIRIWDNGKGFTIKKQFGGIGLRNIEERVKSISGQLNITSSIGNGTTIDIHVKSSA